MLILLRDGYRIRPFRACDAEDLYAALKAFISEKGYKNGYVLWPVRIAVSGKSVTPAGATEILEILGKEESLSRIRRSIEKLS